MKIQKLAATICLTTMLSSMINAQNAVIPLFFHKNVSNLSTQQVYDWVCEVNRNYSSNSVPVTWYVGGIDNSTNAGSNWNRTGVNVNIVSSASSYPGGYKVNLDPVDGSDALTHELGHFLSLGHVLTPGNWMYQGQGYPGTFTAAQISAMTTFTANSNTLPNNYKNYTNYFPAGSILGTSSNYIVPIEKITQIGTSPTFSLTFDYYSVCGTASLPTSIICKVYTMCQGADQAILTYNITNYNLPTTIDGCFGIGGIELTYMYGASASHKKMLDANTMPGLLPYSPPVLSMCACSIGGGGGEQGKMAPAAHSEGKQLSISLLVDNNLTEVSYVNSHFSRAEVFDMSGKILLRLKLENGTSKIDISSLPQGMYIFKALASNGEIKVVKFNKR